MKKNIFLFILFSISMLIIITIFSCEIPDKSKDYNYNDKNITKNDNDNNDNKNENNNDNKIEFVSEYTNTTSMQIPIQIPIAKLKERLAVYAKNINYNYNGKNKIGFNVDYPYVYWKKKKVGFVTVKYPVLRWREKKVNLNCKIKVDSKISDMIFKDISDNNFQIFLKVETDARISDVELLTIKLPVLNESYKIKLLTDNTLKLSGTADLNINNELMSDSNNIFKNKINHVDYDLDASLFGSSTLGNFVVSLIGSDQYVDLLKDSAEKQINEAVTEIVETKIKPYVDEIIKDIINPICLSDGDPNIWLTLNSEENKLFNFFISPIKFEGAGETAVITSSVGIYGKPFFTIGNKPEIITDTSSDFIFSVKDIEQEDFEIAVKAFIDKQKLSLLLIDLLQNSELIKSNNIIINNLAIDIVNGVPKIQIDFADLFESNINIDCQLAYDFEKKKLIIYSANFSESSQAMINNSGYNILFNNIAELIKMGILIDVPGELNSVIESMSDGDYTLDGSSIIINSTINNIKISFNETVEATSKDLEMIIIINGKFEPINIEPLIF